MVIGGINPLVWQTVRRDPLWARTRRYVELECSSHEERSTTGRRAVFSAYSRHPSPGKPDRMEIPDRGVTRDVSEAMRGASQRESGWRLDPANASRLVPASGTRNDFNGLARPSSHRESVD